MHLLLELAPSLTLSPASYLSTAEHPLPSRESLTWSHFPAQHSPPPDTPRAYLPTGNFLPQNVSSMETKAVVVSSAATSQAATTLPGGSGRWRNATERMDNRRQSETSSQP